MLKRISDAYKKTGFLHHAYLVDETLSAELFSFIERDLLVPLHGNPDFSHIVTETFGIDEARRLKEISSRKAVSKRQVTVLTFNSITREAQNALLKLFEEPTENTHFFLVTKSPERILPTLFSRLFIVRGRWVCAADRVGKNFLQLSVIKRINYLQPIIETKNKRKALTLLDELKLLLRQKLLQSPSLENTRSLRELTVYKGYLSDRGASIKMILEHIALTV